MTSSEFESHMKKLPVIPHVAAKIISMAEDNEFVSFKDLEEIIMLDPLLSSRILKVANSAMYARQKEITNLQSAIILLGFKTIKSMVMLISASNMFSEVSKTRFYRFFWQHSLLTAFIAKDIAMTVGLKSQIDEFFLAGLFHDIGQVALFHSDPEAYSNLYEQVHAGKERTIEIERRILGTDHKEVGGEILSYWNFPVFFSDSAREHGSLNIISPHKSMILLITAADIISTYLLSGKNSNYQKQILETIPKYTTLTLEKLSYYQEEYMSILEKAPLFIECRSIFQL
ncbi:MAG: HDOD domain-containing protein [Spirochaetales bacterium]|nr:HDOD domain-containing protein [Spirochaetales bacterium]